MLYIDDTFNTIPAGQLAEIISGLPAWRRDLALKFKFEQGRRECALSYRLLCRALKEEFGIVAEPTFDYNEHGKPTLREFPDIHFNISHCKNAIACIVSNQHPVGIDVECIGRFSDSAARYVLNDEEYNNVIGSGNPDVEFTKFWTRKEAIYKFLGTGIEDDIKNILVKHPDIPIYTEVHADKGYVYSYC